MVEIIEEHCVFKHLVFPDPRGARGELDTRASMVSNCTIRVWGVLDRGPNPLGQGPV